MFGLPLLMVSATLIHFSLFKYEWIEPLYIISLTANIGYFTNYIAIKMLFKPYQKTAFGRQGLIPRNQSKLADSLSETLIENFLSRQQWREYLVQSDLINQVVQEAKQASLAWLTQSNNIALASEYLIDFLEKNKASFNKILNDLQSNLLASLSTQINTEQLLAAGLQWLEKQFDENPDEMQAMIEPIIKTVAENVPQIAESLVDALDEHIEDQDTFKRGIAKMARWSADFSSEDIKHYLFRMLASFEFRQTLFDGLKTLVCDYKHRSSVAANENSTDITLDNGSMDEPPLAKFLTTVFTDKESPINWIELIIKKLNSPSGRAIDSAIVTNAKLARSLENIHFYVFETIESELNDGPFHTWIIEELISMIEKLDLRQLVKKKAKSFSPKKMENIFQNMISEQLVFIELLGAFLGALSGLALVDIRLFTLLASAMACIYLTDQYFTSRRPNSELSSDNIRNQDS